MLNISWHWQQHQLLKGWDIIYMVKLCRSLVWIHCLHVFSIWVKKLIGKCLVNTWKHHGFLPVWFIQWKSSHATSDTIKYSIHNLSSRHNPFPSNFSIAQYPQPKDHRMNRRIPLHTLHNHTNYIPSNRWIHTKIWYIKTIQLSIQSRVTCSTRIYIPITHNPYMNIYIIFITRNNHKQMLIGYIMIMNNPTSIHQIQKTITSHIPQIFYPYSPNIHKTWRVVLSPVTGQRRVVGPRFVFPHAPENAWGGLLGRAFGTHSMTVPGNRAIVQLRVGSTDIL